MKEIKTKHPKVSLIVSTYNRPDALKVCLDSIRYQTVMPNEVIIGDDGSKEDTKNMIEIIKKDFPTIIIHIWQEDTGFRLAKMRNKCIAAATSEYIIEIDGDVFLSKYFIEDHLALSKKGFYSKGGRVNLNEKLTNEICKLGKFRKISFFTKGIESKRENSIRFIYLAKYLSSRYRKNKSVALGCNMSFWKEDAITINGYDENYEGWGCEDHDFAHRLNRAGIKKTYLKLTGIVYHLWHEDKHMYNLANNLEYEKKQHANKIIYCEKGIDQYL